MEIQKTSAAKAQYPLGRDFHASARLGLQHLLWNIRLGYLLHPAIDLKSDSGIRIADIGTGNALWPLELSQHLRSDAHITGYDISAEQFPAKEWLPPQLRLETLDIMNEELPKELENAFDVVHIRAFVCVVQAGDPRKLMAKMAKMLKPGGYLQWDEVDVGVWQAQSPKAAAVKTASSRLIEQATRYWHDGCGLQFVWVKHLKNYFSNSCFDIIHESRLPNNNATLKLETDDHMMALEELSPKVVEFFSRSEGRTIADSRESLQIMIDEAVQEAREGVVLKMDWYTCLGRKRNESSEYTHLHEP